MTQIQGSKIFTSASGTCLLAIIPHSFFDGETYRFNVWQQFNDGKQSKQKKKFIPPYILSRYMSQNHLAMACCSCGSPGVKLRGRDISPPSKHDDIHEFVHCIETHLSLANAWSNPKLIWMPINILLFYFPEFLTVYFVIYQSKHWTYI